MDPANLISGGATCRTGLIVSPVPLLLALTAWETAGFLAAGVCVCGAAAWKWRAKIGRKLDLHQDVTAVVTVTDPHGLHMRRCKDLVNVARRNITYRVLVRPQSGSRRSWADARSILSIHSLGVRGARAGDAPPALEIRIQGFRPRHVLREIREVLEGEPHKYLSPLEIYELAQKTGGRLVAAIPKQKARGLGSFIGFCRKAFLGHFLR